MDLCYVPTGTLRQSKQTVKPGQGKTSRLVKTADREGFGQRLREAFGGALNAEIARILKRSEPAVKNYMDGRIPTADDLVSISALTGCSVHWLLTGDGPKTVTDADVSSGPLFKRDSTPPKLSKKDREFAESLISVLEKSLKE